MVFVLWEKPIKKWCLPPHLSDVFPNVAFTTVPVFVWLTLALSRPFRKDRRALPLFTPHSSKQSMMWCPWLCAHMVSQAPQHFRSSETQTTCDGCFARQSIVSVIALHSGVSRAARRNAVKSVWEMVMSRGRWCLELKWSQTTRR